MNKCGTIKMKQTETQLVKACLELLNYKKIMAWRNNTGAFRTERGGFYRMGLLGSGDIFAVMLPNGTLLAIECKVGRGVQSPSQCKFQATLEANKGIYWLIRSVDELVDRVEDYKTKLKHLN